MTFTDELAPVADPVWDAILDHPMVRQLGDGSLDTEPFEYWVKQDYVYLLDSTIDTEMDLHRAYAAEFGITESELEATTASPTTRAYTDFLVRVAATGTFGDLVAVLLPCMWGFNETGLRLAEDGTPDDDRYAEWIRTYSGEEFTELTTWCKELMDRVAAGAGEEARDRYRDLFYTSARYEYRFWDAAWRQEDWEL
jgi:thiaminase/transcriptional activator TenA